MTPLFIAATYGYEDICHRLIEKGANIICKDEASQTALHRAASEGHLVYYIFELDYFLKIIVVYVYILKLYNGILYNLSSNQLHIPDT